MKILVTGGAGFIASHIVDKYIELGHEVVVIDNLSSGNYSNINSKAKFYLMDVCSPEISKVFEIEKPEILNHHAAQISVPESVKDPLLDAEINSKGFLNLLENCVKFAVKKVIFISSGGAVYGEAEEYPTTEEYLPKPVSPYAIHKFVSEKYLYFYKHQYNLNYTVLRYANVFGPRQEPHGEAGVVSIFIEKLLQNETPHLYAYPEEPDGMIRDYVFVKDVVNANVIALSNGEGDAFNIGTGCETTTGFLLSSICEILDKQITPIPGEARPGDIRKSCLVAKKANDVLNWKPQFSLESGLRETCDFFLEKYNKKS